MKDFAGKIAVVTGGGTGMGRELVRQLVAEGCNVAMCDVSAENMAETKRLCETDGLPQGVRVTTHVADVSDEAQVLRFADGVRREHATDKVHLLFNNAGIGGAGSLFKHTREQWDRTFNICWGGVYYCTRAFLQMLVTAPEGHIVNTSSINGAWASVGPTTAHTSYSAAKFAVKGFTEALMTDLKLNAPHVKCSVVMPGRVGTSIFINSSKVHNGRVPGGITAEDIAQARVRLSGRGVDAAKLPDKEIEKMLAERARRFRDEAPLSAAGAAKIILDGVKAGRWRILVGKDAERIDELIRETPERAYEPEFYRQVQAETGWPLR